MRQHDIRSFADFKARFRRCPSLLTPAPVGDAALLRPVDRARGAGLTMRLVERVLD